MRTEPAAPESGKILSKHDSDLTAPARSRAGQFYGFARASPEGSG